MWSFEPRSWPRTLTAHTTYACAATRIQSGLGTKVAASIVQLQGAPFCDRGALTEEETLDECERVRATGVTSRYTHAAGQPGSARTLLPQSPAEAV